MYIIVEIKPEKNLRNPWNHIKAAAYSLAEARKISKKTGLRYAYVPDEVFERAESERLVRELCPEKPLYL